MSWICCILRATNITTRAASNKSTLTSFACAAARSRNFLHNSDRIEFGVRDSYQLTFSAEQQDIQRLLGQFGSLAAPAGESSGAGNLIKLRSLVEVARALQNSLSTSEVLTAVVDAALTVTGCERGFLLLQKGEALEVFVARDQDGLALASDDLRVPTSVIQRALNSRR